MKAGDIVTVHDGSWCLFYAGEGELHHINGLEVAGRQWTILANGIQGPIHDGGRAESKNDTMLAEVSCPENILFTQLRFCAFVRHSDSKPGPV